jgi:hypothetical protein
MIHPDTIFNTDGAALVHRIEFPFSSLLGFLHLSAALYCPLHDQYFFSLSFALSTPFDLQSVPSLKFLSFHAAG